MNPAAGRRGPRGESPKGGAEAGHGGPCSFTQEQKKKVVFCRVVWMGSVQGCTARWGGGGAAQRISLGEGDLGPARPGRGPGENRPPRSKRGGLGGAGGGRGGPRRAGGKKGAFGFLTKMRKNWGGLWACSRGPRGRRKTAGGNTEGWAPRISPRGAGKKGPPGPGRGWGRPPREGGPRHGAGSATRPSPVARGGQGQKTRGLLLGRDGGVGKRL